MPVCANCGENLVRSHRKLWEKFVYSLVFRCKTCGLRKGAKYRAYFYFSKHCKCPRCGTEDVDKRSSRDRIDRVAKTPMSILQAIIGGNLYHCVYCRMQFYDIRSRSRNRTKSKQSVDAA